MLLWAFYAYGFSRPGGLLNPLQHPSDDDRGKMMVKCSSSLAAHWDNLGHTKAELPLTNMLVNSLLTVYPFFFFFHPSLPVFPEIIDQFALESMCQGLWISRL